MGRNGYLLIFEECLIICGWSACDCLNLCYIPFNLFPAFPPSFRSTSASVSSLSLSHLCRCTGYTLSHRSSPMTRALSLLFILIVNLPLLNSTLVGAESY